VLQTVLSGSCLGLTAGPHYDYLLAAGFEDKGGPGTCARLAEASAATRSTDFAGPEPEGEEPEQLLEEIYDYGDADPAELLPEDDAELLESVESADFPEPEIETAAADPAETGSDNPGNYADNDARIVPMLTEDAGSLELDGRPAASERHIAGPGLAGQLWEAWAAAAQHAVDVLHERERAISSVEVGQDGLLSIVEYCDPFSSDSHVVLVHWLNAQQRFGQIVTLDDADRIKFSPVVTHPYRSFRGCTLVHPAVAGARMIKIARSGRPQFPDHGLRLKRMWEVALAGGMSNANLGTSLCCLCQLEQGFEGAPLRTCPFCSFTWHASCCEQAMSLWGRCARWPSTKRGPGGQLNLPACLQSESVLCSLCRAWLR